MTGMRAGLVFIREICFHISMFLTRKMKMTLEEIQIIDAPSDATFWGGVALGTVATVGIGLLFIS